MQNGLIRAFRQDSGGTPEPVRPSIRSMKSIHAACAVLVPALLAGGCSVRLDSQSQISREEKRFTVSGTPAVRVTTFDGAIEIQSWDKPDVLVEIEKRGPTREAIEELEVKTSQDGNTIELEVKRPASESLTHIGFHVSASAKLMVWVPRKADIRARSGDGSIRIARVDGRIELHTGDGSIKAEEISGELTLTTGDGSVTVDGAEGRLALETGDGGVNVTGKLGAVRLHTGDGSIVYRSQPGAAMEEDWDITTGDGSVSLYLPSEFGAELDAHTGDGSIRNDLNVTSAESPERNRRTVKGRLGSGGKQLRIRTGDGSIRLRSL
jgi:DUF4097 and DUF4098 domain-containing protein YvlB